MTRRSSYFPDDLPQPKSAANIERQYLQCGCIVSEAAQNEPSYSNYGDLVPYIPATGPRPATFPMKRSNSSGSPIGSPPRSVSPPLSESGDEDVVRMIDPGFCERSSCKKSSIFNKEWNRIWEANCAEMKRALDESDNTNGKTYEEFKARIRKEAQVATEVLLRNQQ